MTRIERKGENFGDVGIIRTGWAEVLTSG